MAIPTESCYEIRIEKRGFDSRKMKLKNWLELRSPTRIHDAYSYFSIILVRYVPNISGLLHDYPLVKAIVSYVAIFHPSTE
jgi:hypothetical protein